MLGHRSSPIIIAPAASVADTTAVRISAGARGASADQAPSEAGMSSSGTMPYRAHTERPVALSARSLGSTSAAGPSSTAG